ncbi:SDR family NAD(P)-dependent oxidoreductase [Marinicella sp. W31]|uniref:SDR family NAD(P)-dependent oxidoreductase n=1 Tax=Marinicella sp. W31 TaxID=3023713 RepID=UPI0037568E2F
MKTMVITGGASGLGRALATKAAEQGWNIAIADINDEAGEAAAQEIAQKGVKSLYHHCDISQRSDFEKLLTAVLNQFGRVDVLVNNAGVASAGFLSETTEAEWERLLQLNVMSCVRGSHVFLPELVKSGKTADNPVAIVNVASLAALMLAPGMMSYNVAKASVLAFSESLRGEVDHQNIHVVAACPGFFKTNLVSSMDGVNQQLKDRIESWMQRSDFTAEDVASDILEAVEKRRFLVLCDGPSKKLNRIKRWFPEYFYRIKMKRASRMFKVSEDGS